MHGEARLASVLYWVRRIYRHDLAVATATSGKPRAFARAALIPTAAASVATQSSCMVRRGDAKGAQVPCATVRAVH